jgi:hypothetical protein
MRGLCFGTPQSGRPAARERADLNQKDAGMLPPTGRLTIGRGLRNCSAEQQSRNQTSRPEARVRHSLAPGRPIDNRPQVANLPHMSCLRAGNRLLCGLQNKYLLAIRIFQQVHERHLLHYNIAPLSELDRCRDLADQPLIRQVLARRGHTLHVEVAFEVVFDLSG